MHFEKEKLNFRYVGPNRIQEWIDNVAYRLKLPIDSAMVHSTFYLSMLEKIYG